MGWEGSRGPNCGSLRPKSPPCHLAASESSSEEKGSVVDGQYLVAPGFVFWLILRLQSQGHRKCSL